MSAHVLVRVPGKINLQLSVGPLQKDGFHPVATVFQAVSIFDDVRVELNDDGLVHVKSTAKTNNHLPLDKENLAAKAVELMRKKFEYLRWNNYYLNKGNSNSWWYGWRKC